METACSSVTMKMLRDIMEADDAVINLMIHCGVSAPLLSKNNATEVAYEWMIYQVVQKRFAELNQLRQVQGRVTFLKTLAV